MSFFGFSILDLKKTIHFTSLHFHSLGVRPAFYCGVMMRGLYGAGCIVSIYGAVVLWRCCGVVCGIVCGVVCIYIWKMGKMGKRKTYLGFTLAYLGCCCRWCRVVSCRVLGLAALLAVVVSVVGFVVFGVPAVAVTATGVVVAIFVDARLS